MSLSGQPFLAGGQPAILSHASAQTCFASALVNKHCKTNRDHQAQIEECQTFELQCHCKSCRKVTLTREVGGGGTNTLQIAFALAFGSLDKRTTMLTRNKINETIHHDLSNGLQTEIKVNFSNGCFSFEKNPKKHARFDSLSTVDRLSFYLYLCCDGTIYGSQANRARLWTAER